MEQNTRPFQLVAAACLLAVGCLAVEKTAVPGIIDRIQNDIADSRYYASILKGDVACYDISQYDLSEFRRDFVSGHFDEDQLDAVIGDLQDLVDRHLPGPKLRDALLADIRDLRLVRVEHEREAFQTVPGPGA